MLATQLGAYKSRSQEAVCLRLAVVVGRGGGMRVFGVTGWGFEQG